MVTFTTPTVNDEATYSSGVGLDDVAAVLVATTASGDFAISRQCGAAIGVQERPENGCVLIDAQPINKWRASSAYL